MKKSWVNPSAVSYTHLDVYKRQEFACVFGVGAELVCDAVILHGTDEQKEKYVRPLLKGELFAAECLTEPTGGSDFFGSRSRAEDKGDYFLLNGNKRFIVGGEGADFFLVYAVTDPQVRPQEGITAFIVERGPGVETKYLYGLMGCRGGGTARLLFRDVKVPRENVVGKVNGAYDVFNTMMIPERLGTAAMTIGAARPALEIATSYTCLLYTSKRIEGALDEVNLQEIPPDKLLDYKLKYTEALKTEYIDLDTMDPAPNTEPNTIMEALGDLLLRIKQGRVTNEQASRESMVIANILKAYETAKLKEKIEVLETIIGGRV